MAAAGGTNDLLNGILGLPLSGNRNVYRLSNNNGKRSVLVNKNTIFQMVQSELIKNIKNLNALIGKKHVFETRKGTLGVGPVRHPLGWGNFLNAKNLSHYRLPPGNLNALASLKKANTKNNEKKRKAVNKAVKNAQSKITKVGRKQGHLPTSEVNVYRVSYFFPEEEGVNLEENGWNGPWLVGHMWLGPNFRRIRNVSTNSRNSTYVGNMNINSNDNRLKWLRKNCNISRVEHWKKHSYASTRR